MDIKSHKELHKCFWFVQETLTENTLLRTDKSAQQKPIYKGILQIYVPFGEPSQTSFLQLLLSFCLFFSYNEGKSFCQL